MRESATREVGVQESAAYGQRWWVLGVLSLSLLLISLDNTILNVAIPPIQQALGATTAELQWIIDSYVLVFAGLLLAAGALGDRFGRRRALLVGLALFGLSSLGAALSSTSQQLVIWRGLTGVGGALIMPATLSLLTCVFPAHERPRAIGIWAGVSGVGIGLGPIAGGVLIEHFHWSSVFLINLPVAAAALIAGRWLVPESRDPQTLPVDWVGTVVSTAGLGLLIYGIIEAPSIGWTHTRVLVTSGLGTALLAAFATWEVRTPHPMIDIRFFRSARFTAACLSVTMVFFALFGSLFALTQLMQFVFGYSALEAGVRLAPIAAATLAGSMLGGRLVSPLGAKRTVAIGLFIVAGGLLLFSQQADGGYPILLGSLLVIGGGMGLAIAPSTDAIMGSLPTAKLSVGSAMNDATRQVGGALGVAILGSVLSSAYRERVREALVGLPAQIAEPASDSLGAALAASRHLAGPAGQALANAARAAFIDAVSFSVLVASGVAFLGAVLALVFLPARELRTQAEIDVAFMRSQSDR
ncbi:MAG: DHA2 family efflux MFS transporter permease subunit [Dehalococcoidia bacterium]|nr:DHA2 family efflux MFS transporter permease subunit [Dehalococcoidia bacterium]